MKRLRTFRVGDHPAGMILALVLVLGAGAAYDFARWMASPTTTTVVLAVEPPIISQSTIPTPVPLPSPLTTTTQPTITQPETTKPETTTTTANVTISVEAELVIGAATDMLRVSEGLPPVTVDAGLQSYARDWAAHMAATGNLTHSNINDLLDHWNAVGENIAEGVDPLIIFEDLVSSPGHLNIILNGAYAFDGVGVAVDGSGRLWLCHVLAGINTPITTTTLPLP